MPKKMTFWQLGTKRTSYEEVCVTQKRVIFEFPGFTVDETGQFVNEETGHVLNLSLSSGNTLKVNFKVGGRIYSRSAAKIVCTMFHGRPKNSEMVSYKDDDPLNINASNLEWKPRWFIHENRAQQRRNRPQKNRPVKLVETGEIFENALVAARHFGILEKYIMLAAEQYGGYGPGWWVWSTRDEYEAQQKGSK
jgi:hypothetical protein